MNGNINKRIAVLLSFCLLCMAVYGQVAIHGSVSTEGKPLGGVRIDLRRDCDNKMLAYTFSDGQGNIMCKQPKVDHLRCYSRR